MRSRAYAKPRLGKQGWARGRISSLVRAGSHYGNQLQKRYFGNTSRETTPAYEHDGDKQSSVGWLRTLNSGLLPFVSRVDQIDADVDLYRAGRDCRFNAKRFGP
jgi:hypothetical protein